MTNGGRQTTGGDDGDGDRDDGTTGRRRDFGLSVGSDEVIRVREVSAPRKARDEKDKIRASEKRVARLC